MRRLLINETQFKYLKALREEETRDEVSLAVLLNPENKVALFKRSADETTKPNYWGLVGGGVDAGETPDIAIVREIEEEAGVSLSNFTFLRDFMNGKTKIHVFGKRVEDLDVVLNEEHSEWGWFSPEEFKDLSPIFENTKTNYESAVEKLAGLAEAAKSDCQTNDAVYGFEINSDKDKVSIEVELPMPLDIDTREEKNLEKNAHNAMELVLSKYFVGDKGNELYEGVLNEYPESFDIDTFKKLGSFRKRIEYAREHLKVKSKQGSSRVVLPVDNDMVLKIAKNKKGIAQNEAEVENWINLKSLNHDHMAAPVLDWDDDDFFYVEMKRVETLNNSKFKKLFGFDASEFFQHIKYRVDLVLTGGRNRIPTYIDDQDELQRIEEDETFGELVEMFCELDSVLSVKDAVVNNFGYHLENGQPELVMLDYGLSSEVAAKHYGI